MLFNIYQTVMSEIVNYASEVVFGGKITSKMAPRMFLREGGGDRGFTMKDQAFTEEEQNNNALEENNKKSK